MSDRTVPSTAAMSGAPTTPRSRAPYDTIVIGAGLNGLTTAAYLGRAGARVLVLDRRDRIGGSTITEEFAPGFSADVCRHDAGWVSPRIQRDLDLARHGLKLLSGGSPTLALSPDGIAFPFTPSLATNGDALKRLSTADAARWPAFSERVRALSGFLAHLYAAPVPSVDASSFADLKTAAQLGLRFRGLGKRDMVALLRVLPMSIAEWLDDTFESPLLKGALASRGILNLCQGPRAAATAFNFLHHHVGGAAGALASPIAPMGGVGAIVRALADSARAAGAEIRTNAPVARINIRGGVASGVVLESGEEIAARAVASSASPRDTFLSLCDPSQLAPEFVSAVRHVRYRGIWAKVNLAVERMPKFNGVDVVETKARGVVVAPSMDYLERAYDDAKYGRVSATPFLDVTFPRRYDDPSAPKTGQVISIHFQYAPYHRRDGVWDAASRDALGDLAIGTLAEYAPELPSLVKHRQVFTPVDLEETFGLPEGHAYHGEMMLDQAMFMRPVPACSHYGSPVRGVYVCGSGAHPGGGIAGGAGANAARVILADRKR